MTKLEERKAAIMAAARGIQRMLEDGVIRIDTVVITDDKITLIQGNIDGDYRVIQDIYIDDKAIEEFYDSLEEPQPCGAFETEEEAQEREEKETAKAKPTKAKAKEPEYKMPRGKVRITTGRIFW